VADADLTRYTVMATWDDVPHLDEQAKGEMLKEYPAYQRDARSRGIPALGSGTIYPIPESEIRVAPFEIPAHWPRVWGADTDAGAGWTAAIWLAWDREANCGYIYDIYKRSHAEPAVHIEAIKARGAWIPGVADAAGLAVTAYDSEQVISAWKNAGLDVTLPAKAIEAGLQSCWELLSAGRLKVFTSCGAWFEEYRLYRRDEKGRIVKKDDHLQDACVSGDTPVWTSDGVIPISELVGRDGWVVSRDGVLARFLGARKVFDDVPVVNVAFSDGSNVVCTPDHPFLTPKGWVRADAMMGLRCYNPVEDGISWKTPLWYRQRFKPLVASITTCAASTFRTVETFFTERCGNVISDRFRKVVSSITSTGTLRTMPSTISLSWATANTFGITLKGIDIHGPKRREPVRLSGIEALSDVRFIERTTTRLPTNFIQSLRSSANAAAIKCSARVARSFARAAATPRIVARTSWTVLNWCAWSVARLTRHRSSTNQKRAAGGVVSTSVVAYGKSDVYCLTVPGLSAFAVGSGTIVHNTRYAIVSGRARMKTKGGSVSDGTLTILDPASAAVSWMQ
jgi:hypothetical protein